MAREAPAGPATALARAAPVARLRGRARAVHHAGRPRHPPNHGSVLVVYEGSRYVVDASILHSEPAPRPRRPLGHRASGLGRAVRKRDGQWYMRWRSMFSSEGLDCRFEAMSVTRDTFRERYEAARAWGPFNYELHFRLIRGEAIVGAARGERVEFDRSGACVRTPLADAERRRFLIEDLGIHEAIVQRLPPIRRRPPPWSRTAQSSSAERASRGAHNAGMFESMARLGMRPLLPAPRPR